MKKNRFASYLLTGKAATLPLLFQQALAADPPKGSGATVAVTAESLLTDQFNLLQRPVAGSVQLVDGPYGPIPTLCTNTSVPNVISTVVTGLKPGDKVFIATSTKTDSDTAAAQKLSAVNNSIEIGVENILVAAAFTFNPTVDSQDGAVPANLRGTITMPISIDKLKAKGYSIFQDGGRFYMQAIVLPAGADGTNLANYRYSRMNRFEIGKCASTYGGSAY